MSGMRWKALFDDLEAQAEAGERLDLEAEVRDRTRRETALVPLADRLRAAVGRPLTVRVLGAGLLRGTATDAAPDWLLLEDDRADLLVPLGAVLAVTGAGSAAQPAPGAVAARLDLRHALRGLARDRSAVSVVLRDGSVLSGTIDRVGADHLDLAEHALGEARRGAAVHAVQLLPLDALALLRPGRPGSR